MAAVVPMVFASPAGAVDGCDAGIFPSTFGAQSGLKVACHTDPGTVANHVEIHDAPNAEWHHGGARTQLIDPTAVPNATTINSTTLRFAAGQITAADVRRPITAFVPATQAPIFKGGTFIRSVNVGTTTAILSQTASSTNATVNATIEHTNNRFLHDVTCAVNSTTITSTTGTFAATDVGKSVSGGPFGAGVHIVAPVTATTATLSNTTHPACSSGPPGGPAGQPGDQIQIGGTTYVGGVPQLFNTDPMTVHLSNTTGGGSGFTATTSGANCVVAMSAASKADTGGFNAAYIGMSIVLKAGAAAPIAARKITAVNVAGNSSATVPGACPAGTAANGSFAAVGVKGAGAPANKSAMMSLGAELNLNPVLVSPQDNCDAATYEGFMVIGGWTNPGAGYAANTSTPPASTGQVIFPTSVLSFNGFVVPQGSGDTVEASDHYDFSFPVLPTSLAVCALPTSHVQLTLGVDPTTLAGAPFLPTGSGNIGDPAVRSILPLTGTFSQTIQLLNGASVLTTDTPSCTIAAPTAVPGTPCGDG